MALQRCIFIIEYYPDRGSQALGPPLILINCPDALTSGLFTSQPE